MNKEDYFKYYIQGSDHYLIPKDVFIELFNEMINWKEKSKKKKEVIDKAIEYINNLECLHIGIGENEYNLDKMYGSTKNYVRDLLEILKGSDSNE